jgi:hypothetical protein
MPLSAGIARKNASSASSPPADDPIPTIGVRGVSPASARRRVRLGIRLAEAAERDDLLGLAISKFSPEAMPMDV